MISLSIKGMTCPHCVASVKETLDALEGVSSAEVSLENNQAIIKTSADNISKEILIAAVIDAGYEAS